MQVRRRTAGGSDGYRSYNSHVMEYGSSYMKSDLLSNYMGIDTTASSSSSSYTAEEQSHLPSSLSLTRVNNVAQRDADLLHFRHKVLTC